MTWPIIKLPFPGFYNTCYSDAVDREGEMYAEHIGEMEREKFAPELRLTDAEIGEVLFDVTDYSAAYLAIAREYVASFDSLASRELGFELRLTFESMSSPREYNFETDRIFAFITHKAICAMFAMSKKDKHVTLAEVIKDRFTSYDGFMSWYKTSLDTWLAKPLRDWDHNELETLLLACCKLVGIDETLADDCYEYMSDSDFNQAWDGAVDWNECEAKCAELRAGKVADLKANDPDYIAPPERCPYTLDLFERRA